MDLSVIFTTSLYGAAKATLFPYGAAAYFRETKVGKKESLWFFGARRPFDRLQALRKAGRGERRIGQFGLRHAPVNRAAGGAGSQYRGMNIDVESARRGEPPQTGWPGLSARRQPWSLGHGPGDRRGGRRRPSRRTFRPALGAPARG